MPTERGLSDPNSPEFNGQPDQRISALVNEYFDRRQAGETLTPEQFAAEHAELADELRPYLEGLALIDQARLLADTAPMAEAPPTMPGLPTISGYELLEEIGRGGMGVVYRALQRTTKRIVAVKVMLAGPFAAPAIRRRFEREVELAARLQHPSIVRVLESGEVAGQQYYAMDYVPGIRLDRYLTQTQPEIRTTLNLFVQLCEAVEYAHGHGVVHRDLKPGNILIDEEGNPHILDFGLAKATDQPDGTRSSDVSIAGQVVGTLFYLSPEQASGTPGEVDARTDVYALGVMLFEALTGSLPYDATGRPSDVILRILETAPTRPRTLAPRMGGELETIVLKALEKDKSRRFQSAKELADDLRRYLAGEPIHARRPSGLYILRKKLRKHRLVVGVTTAAVALAIAITLTAWRWHAQDVASTRHAALDAQRAIEAGAPALALGAAQSVYTRHPELPETALVWAQAQYRNEETRYQAAGFLERILERDPARWPCRLLLAEIFQAAGDTTRADALRAQAEQAAQSTAEAWYIRSFATLDAQRALHCSQEAVRRQSSHSLAWRRLSYLRLLTGDADGALAAADQLIALGQDRYEWTLFKGHVLARQGRFAEAAEEYTRVRAYAHRASAHRRLKQYAQAVDDYTRTIETDKGASANVWHFYQRATPLWILERREEALEDYRRVRMLLGRPFYSDVRSFFILHELNRPEEAAALARTCLNELQPGWLHRVFRCLVGEITPAELVASPLAQSSLESLCEAYYYAGEMCLVLGRPGEARQWFEKCVQTGVQFDPDAALATPMNEYELAQWRLDSRFGDRQPTSRP